MSIQFVNPECVEVPKYGEIIEDPFAIKLKNQYLKYVKFENLNLTQTYKLKQILIYKIIIAVREFLDALTELHFDKPDNGGNNPHWGTCDSISHSKTKCQSVMRRVFDDELNSTAYMLRTLSAATLWANTSEPQTMSFEITAPSITYLNGEWNNDAQWIKIVPSGVNNSPSTCIMGFGPSASGKTHWAKTIVNLMYAQYQGDFPNRFFSIDGGIFRDTSELYGALGDSPYHVLSRVNLQQTNNECPNSAWRGGMVSFGLTHLGYGFSDLIKGLGNSIFNSQKVKKDLSTFLKKQENVSLYVPTTLSSCYASKISSCASQYNKYISIAKAENNWIGMFIWMHKNKCTYSKKFRCETCEVNGTKREKMEGKKFSSKAWDLSYNNGFVEMLKAPRGRYKIHNSGSNQRVSVVVDFSKNDVDKLPENKQLYILDYFENINDSSSTYL